MTQPTHVSGTIKPLKWSNDGDLHRGLLEGGGIGRYCVWVWQDAISSEWVFGGNKSRHPTLEAAQAAAQASYEARIAAQIQPAPDTQPVAWAEMYVADDSVYSISNTETKIHSTPLYEHPPATRAEVSVAEAARLLVHLIDNGRGSVEGDRLSYALSWHGLDAEDFADALRALTEAGE